MAEPMKIRAKLEGDVLDVRVLMAHPMETGQRKDGAGNLVPLHFIQTITAQLNGKTGVPGRYEPGDLAQPGVRLQLKGAKAGDKLEITWTDNKGDKRTDEIVVGAGRARPPRRPRLRGAAPKARTIRAPCTGGRMTRALALAPRPRSSRRCPSRRRRAVQTARGRAGRHDRGVREVSRGPRGRQSRGAVRGQGRRAVEDPARAEERLAGEQCDLGLGPGVVKGAYVQLPRYFADTGKVMEPSADRPLHGDAARVRRRRARQAAVQHRDAHARPGGPHHLSSPGSRAA